MKLILAKPRGFCAGVDRAIDIVEQALEVIGAPIYVRHEVVHNRFVVDKLMARGVIFIEDVADVPEGATLIFSAHGVAQAVREAAQARHLNVFDATCPLVTKVHMEVVRYARFGTECILIGHAGHVEVQGTLGQYYNPQGGIYLIETSADIETLAIKNPQNVAYITQTTLSVDDTAHIIAALQKKFPHLQSPKKADICYATQNRQDAVKKLAELVDIVIVVGSSTSSNSNRLRELAERLGCRAYLIDSAEDIKRDWLQADDVIGITAGASAPEILVAAVVLRLKNWGASEADELDGVTETINFALPKALRKV